MEQDAKYPAAVECLCKDRDVLLTFYDFPVSPENVIRRIPAWRGAACQRSDLA